VRSSARFSGSSGATSDVHPAPPEQLAGGPDPFDEGRLPPQDLDRDFLALASDLGPWTQVVHLDDLDQIALEEPDHLGASTVFHHRNYRTLDVSS
jgi:hypothetical protein